jgi:hypothetical protein
LEFLGGNALVVRLNDRDLIEEPVRASRQKTADPKAGGDV